MKFAMCLIAAFVLLASPSVAAPNHWNAEKAQGIATQLAESLDGIRNAMRGLEPPVGSGRKAFHAAVDDVRLLRNSSRHLANRLGDGAGYDETYPIYRRIQSIRKDARDNAARAGMIPNDVLAKIDTARDLALQLSAYYEHE